MPARGSGAHTLVIIKAGARTVPGQQEGPIFLFLAEKALAEGGEVVTPLFSRKSENDAVNASESRQKETGQF